MLKSKRRVKVERFWSRFAQTNVFEPEPGSKEEEEEEKNLVMKCRKKQMGRFCP